jgi:Fic family protein
MLAFELDPRGPQLPKDVEEVVNYVRAMNYGLERLSSLPLSLRLIREIHEHLLKDVRGGEPFPGEFRSTQNWIGPANGPLSQATFIPPPPDEMMHSLHNFEGFLHDRGDIPILVHTGLAHAQFEQSIRSSAVTAVWAAFSSHSFWSMKEYFTGPCCI